MNQKYSSYTLGAICEEVSYGYTASATKLNTGCKFLRITDIQSEGIDWKEVPYCVISPKDFEKCKLRIGDIVIARTGNSTGSNAAIKDDISGVFASYLIRFRVNQSLADPFYVAFILKSKKWVDFVESIKGGSAQPGANATQYSSFDFLLPEKRVQTRIAEILSSLDDKIELNRQMNQTLEDIAQALYKHYFVDGIDPDNLPKGWRNGLLGEVCDIRGGGTPKTNVPSYWNGSIYWTSPKDLSNSRSIFLTTTDKKITESGLSSITSGLLPVNTVLLSSRAPIGYLAITDIPVAINQGYIAILPESYFSTCFAFHWLKNNMNSIIQYANGSTFLEISKTRFREIPAIIPPKDKIDSFTKSVENIFDLIKSNTHESELLTDSRDYLLPKLISGEVLPSDLKQIEQVL